MGILNPELVINLRLVKTKVLCANLRLLWCCRNTCLTVKGRVKAAMLYVGKSCPLRVYDIRCVKSSLSLKDR